MINEFVSRNRHGFVDGMEAIKWLESIAPGHIPSKRRTPHETEYYNVTYRIGEKSYSYSAFVGD